jgi:hypothetical protein
MGYTIAWMAPLCRAGAGCGPFEVKWSIHAIPRAGSAYMPCRDGALGPPPFVRSMEHAAPAYYVSRDGVAKEYVRGGRAARRLRRHPTAAELRSLDETPASTTTLLGEDGPVIVVREYAETEPTLLMGRERFVSVDDSCSAELRELTIDESAAAAPVAQACGPPLLPAAQGGPPEFSTLCEALEHTARHAPVDRGITYVSRGRAVFESYAALRAEAVRLLGGLRALGLAPRDVVALQLLEPQLHLRAVWACALGGYPSVTVAVAPKLSPQNAVAAKLIAAVA